MRATLRWTRVVLVMLCTFTLAVGSAQAKKGESFQTGFDEWLAATDGDFDGWTLSGAALNAAGELVIGPGAVSETDPYADVGYYGGNFYNGGSYLVGEATGPEITAAFDFDELIASWNAETPTGTWIEVLVRADLGGRWTKWYNLGIWASGTETIQRHSVRLQGDGDGYVAVDTLVLTDKKAAAGAYQLRVRLFSEGSEATPSVRYLSAAYSTAAPKKADPSTGTSEYPIGPLPVLQCSQMVYEGGNVWCSPTSTAMIVSFWEGGDDCASAVSAAVAGVYDWIYNGTGNWPFNVAYAATYGLQGSVRRFSSMDDIEYWVAQGVPVAISFAWKKGELTGAAVSSSGGHLAVVVGFDGDGNPIVNDPAADPNQGEEVQRTYLRSELEPLWLENSGGTVYLIKQ